MLVEVVYDGLVYWFNVFYWSPPNSAYLLEVVNKHLVKRETGVHEFKKKQIQKIRVKGVIILIKPEQLSWGREAVGSVLAGSIVPEHGWHVWYVQNLVGKWGEWFKSSRLNIVLQCFEGT